MECYYTDEVIEIIEEELQSHQRKLEGSSEPYFDKCQYTIEVLKDLLHRKALRR